MCARTASLHGGGVTGAGQMQLGLCDITTTDIERPRPLPFLPNAGLRQLKIALGVAGRYMCHFVVQYCR